MNREMLEQQQIPVYFAAIAVAALGGTLAPVVFQGMAVLVTPSIALLMYAMFLQIPFLDLRKGLSNRRFLAALLVANFILVPMLVWMLTRSLVDQPALLVGALLVLLTPCIDYVVVFTHIGKGDSQRMLAATPLLLLLQLLLLPLYLSLMLEAGAPLVIAIEPFVQAFLVLIVLPLVLAVVTCGVGRRRQAVQRWNDAWAWAPVPAMAIVLIVVIGSQIDFVMQELGKLLPVVPVYLGFMLLAPLLGALAAWIARLPAGTARSVVFSSSTRNSLVVLPLALALPEGVRELAAAAVITQTLIELISELIYIRAVPALIWRKRRPPR
ncbi:arsenic resistance protein [Phytopseudomonas punonensis]|uniref:Arsenite efflux pump ArsB, ACR3 family n=1 Tax=Phytopseudomonas punonensis TaxID=1220495 RepID=A0A1M7DDL6_9GAMM|nr:arsenic resistance protein [Pseudomonas punonensis]SHL77626.1 Arsenite efflux pump ArsB, ACR3 family [Pseudomonas punonensis]